MAEPKSTKKTPEAAAPEASAPAAAPAEAPTRVEATPATPRPRPSAVAPEGPPRIRPRVAERAPFFAAVMARRQAAAKR